MKRRDPVGTAAAVAILGFYIYSGAPAEMSPMATIAAGYLLGVEYVNRKNGKNGKNGNGEAKR